MKKGDAEVLILVEHGRDIRSAKFSRGSPIVIRGLIEKKNWGSRDRHIVNIEEINMIGNGSVIIVKGINSI